MSIEDLIPEEDVVVTITRGGYAKRTRADLYRAQQPRRHGHPRRAAAGDDIVEHFFATTTHHWLLFFTNLGRVYRAKAYELPEAGRDAKGQHVANLLAFQPDETDRPVLALATTRTRPTSSSPPGKAWSRRPGSTEYDSPRSGGLIAINLRDDDELVGAELVSASDDLLLVSRKGMSVRFNATDEQLRPMGRAHLAASPA